MKNKKIKSLLKSIRVKQWTKNLLVFSAIIFAFDFNKQAISNTSLAFISFCLISSAIYLINDFFDIKSDRLHPVKKFRPIASGELSKLEALLSATILALSSLFLASLISFNLLFIVSIYFLLQIFYCIRLKKEPILDLLSISSGFLLRALAGVSASNLSFSPWFSLSIGLLSLFLAVEKRKAELKIFLQSGVLTRKVLNRYSLELLNRYESVLTSSTFVSYSLWAAGPTLNGAETELMLLTVPFVLLGIFRYQLLSNISSIKNQSYLSNKISTESPEEILLNDKGIKLTITGWLLTIILINFVK
tara:strand:- start:4622 stop:5533 length:912 start_codon:yes stop_codon:yes gene_type:complete